MGHGGKPKQPVAADGEKTVGHFGTNGSTSFYGHLFFLKDLAQLIPFYNFSTKHEGGIKWRWTVSGGFSCASVYKIMHQTGVLSTDQAIWKLKIPMKVKVFLWLMSGNKILTQDILIGRGCTLQSTGCQLCVSQQIETREHLFWDCRYAIRFWVGLLAHYNIPIPLVGPISIIWTMGEKPATLQQKRLWGVVGAAGA